MTKHQHSTPKTLSTAPASEQGSSQANPANDAFPPRELAEYRIVRLLGQGGNGQVYLAEDTVLQRAVAIKFLMRQDPKARKRFLVEARAAARLHHRNVAQVYRVGELDARSYLVSEYVRGVSLDAEPKPVGLERACALGLEITRGLAALHRCGVLHRDIKPANIVVNESGEAKLVDFGLAKLVGEAAENPASPLKSEPEHAVPADKIGVTERGELLGTRYYMAPEMWRGEDATPATDVYSLGVVLYELCTGHVPHARVPRSELAQVVQTEDAPRCQDALPDIDPRFAAIVDRCLAREPGARFGSGSAVREELEALVDRDRHMALPEGNPYRGLRPFEAAHRSLFFGRDADVHAILDRLRAERVVLIAGDSGMGKSSLALAGVIPRVAEGCLGNERAWSVCSLVPGKRPLQALAAALAGQIDRDESSLAELLRTDAEEVSRLLRQRHGEGSGTLILVDQLEEIITLSDLDQAQALAAALATLAEKTPHARVLATVRGDKVTSLARLPGLGALVERALYILLPMGEDGIRDSIVRPARLKGVRFESEALVETLVASSMHAEGGLPLLQFALAKLWEVRDVARGVISTAALTKIGGVEGALSQHADQVVRSLLPAKRHAARSILIRLVTSHGTRARLSDKELVLKSEIRRAALDALIKGRLVVAGESDGQSVYEIAHEALISSWGTLRRWLDEEGSTRIVRERLAAAAAEWERFGRKGEGLWRGRQLAEAVHVDVRELLPIESAFLAASRALDRRMRRLKWSAPLVVILLAALIYGGFQLKEMQERDRRRREIATKVDGRMAEATLHFLYARVQSLAFYTLRKLAFAFFEMGNPGARKLGDEWWQKAIAFLSGAEARYAEATRILEFAFLTDPSRSDVRRFLARVLYERAVLAELTGRNDVRQELVERLRVFDTGQLKSRFLDARKVSLVISPQEVEGELYRYETQTDHARELQEISKLPANREWSLEPGSYLLILRAKGDFAEIHYPFRVAPAIPFETAPIQLTLDLPKIEEMPKGFGDKEEFIYVAPGSFQFGFGGDGSTEFIRSWLQALPIHERTTGPYWIARHETTYEQWILFLRSRSWKERSARLPKADKDKDKVFFKLHLRGSDFELEYRLASQDRASRVPEGQRIIYPGRDRLAVQNWLRFPVTGISGDDADAYVTWLDETGRVPGARLCREDEWERAARGADGRLFAHGNHLEPEDANFDQTYGRNENAFGPDEVGSYPQTHSPFGVEDTIGNAREMTFSLYDTDVLALSGGTYFHDQKTSFAPNRDTMLRKGQWLPTVGLRVCADAPARLRR